MTRCQGAGQARRGGRGHFGDLLETLGTVVAGW